MTAIDGALELRPQRDPLEIRVHEVEKALYVPSVEEFVQSAHGLDVLLRHSPRSISRKVALSMRGRSPSTSVACARSDSRVGTGLCLRFPCNPTLRRRAGQARPLLPWRGWSTLGAAPNGRRDG